MIPTLAIDYDGTIVTHSYPAVGTPIPNAFETLRDLKAAGYRLILWTCREDHPTNINRRFLTDAVEFCRENGVEFDAVNESILDDEFRDFAMLKRKVYATYYIDDRNIGGFVGWDEVRRLFLGGQGEGGN